MKKNYLQKGRVGQKLRTRNDLIETAKRLLKTRGVFSLEDVAEQANVSRATVYRYFSNVDILRLEASLDIETKPVGEILAGIQDQDLESSLLQIQKYFNSLAQNHERTFRIYLSVLLKESARDNKKAVKTRGARRVKAVEEAIAMIRPDLDPKTARNLKHVAAVLMGIEATIVTKDICELDDRQSTEVLQWGLEMILKGIESG